jgi:hypothetical protein
MAITSGSQTVGTAALQIDGVSQFQAHIHIRNNDSTKTLYIGGPDVTTANGLPIDKLTTMQFALPPGESMFMISTDTGHSVSWLRITQD